MESLTVYSYYVLDILHSGHLLLMRNAKALAGPNGKHIVGILTDEATIQKKSKPIISFEERMEIAGAIKYVDLVVAQITYSPIQNIMRLRPDILIESSSHDVPAILEATNIMEKMGGKVVTLPYFPSQSSSAIKDLIKGIKN